MSKTPVCVCVYCTVYPVLYLSSVCLSVCEECSGPLFQLSKYGKYFTNELHSHPSSPSIHTAKNHIASSIAGKFNNTSLMLKRYQYHYQGFLRVEFLKSIINIFYWVGEGMPVISHPQSR